jgi:hypothetical protein
VRDEYSLISNAASGLLVLSSHRETLSRRWRDGTYTERGVYLPHLPLIRFTKSVASRFIFYLQMMAVGQIASSRTAAAKGSTFKVRFTDGATVSGPQYIDNVTISGLSVCFPSFPNVYTSDHCVGGRTDHRSRNNVLY